MFISESTINEIKNRLTISDVVSLYLPLVRKGRDNWVVCPFHSDKNPSMRLDDEKGFYYCFGCKASGNIFTFVMKMDNLDFVEAVKKLASIAHVEIEEDTPYNKKNKDDKATLYALYKALNEEFHSAIMHPKTDEAKRASDYVYSRGYTTETINNFSLGYASSDWDYVKRFAASLNINASLLARSGLISPRGASYFVDRVTFPIVNRSGHVVAFSARTLKSDDSVAKYINSSESPIFSKKMELFGFNNAVASLKSGEIPVLCEGNFDVMALHQAGIKSALATCGTALSKEQCATLRRYNDKARTFFDSDDAGKIATMKALVELKKQGISPSVVVLKRERAKDASELLQKEGALALQDLVNKSVNGFQYALKTLSEKADVTTTKGKQEVFSGLLPLINSVDSMVERTALVKKVATLLALDEESVVNDYNLNINKEIKKEMARDRRREVFRAREKKSEASIWKTYDDMPLSEIELVKELAYSRELLDSLPVLQKIDYKSFVNPKAASIYAFLREHPQFKDENDDVFLEGVEDEEMRSFLERARVFGEKFKALPPEEKERRITHAVLIMVDNMERRKKEVQNDVIDMRADTTLREGFTASNENLERSIEYDELIKLDKKRGGV